MALAGIAAAGGWSDWATKLSARRDIDAADHHRFVIWLAVLGATGLIIAAWSRLRRIDIGLVAFTAMLWFVYGIGLAPSLDASSSARALMQRAAAAIGPQSDLGFVAWREQNLLQADRAVTEFGFKRSWRAQWRDAADWIAAAPHRRWLMTRKDALVDCVDRSAVIDIGRSNRRDWVVLPGTAWSPGCRIDVAH
jgi:hypothetical protein